MKVFVLFLFALFVDQAISAKHVVVVMKTLRAPTTAETLLDIFFPYISTRNKAEKITRWGLKNLGNESGLITDLLEYDDENAFAERWRQYISEMPQDDQISLVILNAHGGPESMEMGAVGSDINDDKKGSLSAEEVYNYFIAPIMKDPSITRNNQLPIYLFSCMVACRSADEGFHKQLGKLIASNEIFKTNPSFTVSLIGHEGFATITPTIASNVSDHTPRLRFLVAKVQKTLIKINSIWMKGTEAISYFIVNKKLMKAMSGEDFTKVDSDSATAFLWFHLLPKIARPLILYEMIQGAQWLPEFNSLSLITKFLVGSALFIDTLRAWFISPSNDDLVSISNISNRVDISEELVNLSDKPESVIIKTVKSQSWFDWLDEFKRSICSSNLTP